MDVIVKPLHRSQNSYKGYPWLQKDYACKEYQEFTLKGIISQTRYDILKSQNPRDANNWLITKILEGGGFVPEISWDECHLISWRFENQHANKQHLIPCKFRRKHANKEYDLIVKVKGIVAKESVNSVGDLSSRHLPANTFLYHSTKFEYSNSILDQGIRISEKRTHGRMFGNAIYTSCNFDEVGNRWGRESILAFVTKRPLRLVHFGNGSASKSLKFCKMGWDVTEDIDTIHLRLKEWGFDGFIIQSALRYVGGNQIGVLDPNDLELVKVIRNTIKYVKNPTCLSQLKCIWSWRRFKTVDVYFDYNGGIYCSEGNLCRKGNVYDFIITKNRFGFEISNVTFNLAYRGSNLYLYYDGRLVFPNDEMYGESIIAPNVDRLRKLGVNI